MNTPPIKLMYGLPFAVLLLMSGCGGGGGSSTPTVRFTGNVVKGPVNNAEVKIFYFDSTGEEVELLADNQPVMTNAAGAYTFEIASSLYTGSGPAIVRTIGGKTSPNNGNAPMLEAVIPNLSIYFTGQSKSITQHLSTASSVAASLLKFEMDKPGGQPTVALAKSVIGRVENQLGVELDDNPTLSTSTAALNSNVDALLALKNSAANNAAINDFVDYLAANLASTSKKLDGKMNDATNSGVDIEASLDGDLAVLFPDGPESLLLLQLAANKAEIENNGLDNSIVTASLRDGTGVEKSSNPDFPGLNFKVLSGMATLGKEALPASTEKFNVRLTSMSPGPVTVEASYLLQNGVALTQFVPVSVVDNVADVEDTVEPRIVSAVASSNNQVIVTFSEPLRAGMDGADNPNFYSIAAVNIPGEQANRPLSNVIDARLMAPDYSSVLLTTGSQSNISYLLRTTNLRDLAGNSFASPSTGVTTVEPSSTTFVGMPPSGTSIVDSDGDGLIDSDELFGWSVKTTNPSGLELTRWVTSDPYNSDTDGDGVPDNEEKHGAIDPRSADTDGDTLSDDLEWNTVFSDALNQDSDGDGVQDGFEYYTFRTSPILADTDGDQMSDGDEVTAGNRNPLIADLPSPKIIVGSVNMQLDTSFTITNEQGETRAEEKTSETTLTRGQNDTSTNSSENSTTNTLEFSQELAVTARSGGDLVPVPGFEVTATAGSKQGSEQGSTFTAGQESGRSSEEAYHDSLTATSEIDSRETVTRDVKGAVLKAFVSIENAGDIPFSIQNLELSAQSQNPNDRSQVIPLAALVPENDSLSSVNIGVIGDTSRGPFVFTTSDNSVFPEQVQELMKNPRGFLVQIANFDVTDEDGNNFSYSSQDVLDRTAGITFDFGDGRQESYRVATASAHDRSSGRPLGITMARALSIIGVQRYQTIRDGGNGIFESTLKSDDILATISRDPFNSSVPNAVEPGEVLVTAGANGLIESTIAGDDILVEADYESEIIPTFATIVDGGNGNVDTTIQGDDIQVLAVGTSANPGEVMIHSGADGILQTIPEADDKIQAPVAPHRLLTRLRDVAANNDSKSFWALFSSTSQSPIDLDNKVLRAGDQYDFSYVQDKDGDGVWASEEALHGSSDRLADTDNDALNDKQEIQEGWKIRLAGSPEFTQVYPNPTQADSDRDMLSDLQEKACELDPRQRDTDLDGLTDWEELNGKRFIQGIESPMRSIDPDTSEVTYTITPYVDDPALVGVPHDAKPECSTLLGIDGFATDPLNKDTDGDLIDDGRELKLGLNPNDASDGGLFLDDDGDGVPNRIETEGYFITVNGATSTTRVTSDPNNRDTDGDGLPDLLEHSLKSNPKVDDTDSDGISDFDEYKTAGEACVTTTVGQLCQQFNTLSSDGWKDYLQACDASDKCVSKTIEADVAQFSQQTGTNINERDSDFDGLWDKTEIDGVEIIVNGQGLQVDSNPLKTNSDEDLLTDLQERTAGTNPREADTDGDSTNDDAESPVGRDPANADKAVTVSSGNISVVGSSRLAFYVYVDGVNILSCDKIDVAVDDSEVPASCTYMTRKIFTEASVNEVVIQLYASEVDDGFDGKKVSDGNDDYCTTITKTFSFSENTDGIDIPVTFAGDCTADLTPTLTLKVTVE